MNLWNDRRLRLTLTRLGMQYLAIMLLLGFFALNSGNNLLYVVFCLMLGLFLVSGWVSRRAIQGLTLHSIQEGNIFARVKGGIRVRFIDRHPLRMRGLEIHMDLRRAQVEPGFYGGGQRGDGPILVVLHTLPQVRGWCRLDQIEFRTRFPFGFIEKAYRFPLAQELLILPHPRSTLAREDDGGDSHHFLVGPGMSSPEGARPFRIGDPLGRMHWKRTAQRGEPWARTFEGELPTGVHLRLDLRRWSPGPDFEKELELISGTILQARLHKQEVFLGVQTQEGLQEHSGSTECWRALAMVQAQGTVGQMDSAAFPPPGLAIL